MKWRSEAGRP